MASEDPTRDVDSTPNRVADAVSIASDFGIAWIVVAFLQVVFKRSTPLDAARRLGIAGTVSLALTRYLKHRYAVPRGEVVAPTLARVPTSGRFPSGHTLAAFTAALTVPTRPAGRAVAMAFAALVAWARVRVGHHRTIDVLAGAGVGTLAGSVLAAVLPSGTP